MTYLVLARKWRPRSFDTLVGQEHVVRALTNALTSGRLHHAWLFTGSRGVGKTTLSRLLAKALNCETGVTASPCGTCESCVDIDAGRFVDYVELDAASNRGVDEMTQLLEQAVYAPSRGRYKVYMIDEVHMLTGHAFNAMLKTLEEPPPHVKFILATTDPQKIPVTVLSRCLQFNLKLMAPDTMVSHLATILQEEKLEFELPALHLIARAASGSMRDALSITEQAIAYGAGRLDLESIQGMLGTIDQGYLVRLLQCLSRSDAPGILALADELAARGLSHSGALNDLAVMLSRIAILQRVPAALSPDEPWAGELAALAEALHPDLVQLLYSIAVHSRHELSLAPDEHAGFLMACLRMLALIPVSDEPQQPGSPKPEPRQARPEPPAPQASETQPPEMQAHPAEDEDAADEGSPEADEAPTGAGDDFDEVAAAILYAESESAPVPDAPPRPAPAAMDAHSWPVLAASLPLTGLAAELARQSEWLGAEGSRITLRVAVQSLAEHAARSRLCTVLSEHFGTAVDLEVECGATGSATAHAMAEAERAELRARAVRSAREDAFVQALIQDFGAELVESSVQVNTSQDLQQ